MAGNVEAIVQRLLPIVPLLISMGVHFVLICFYFLSPWLPAYEFSHLILFLAGLWALLDKESLEAVVSYIAVLVFTILLDIIQLGLYFPAQEDANGGGDSTSQRTWQFSAACVIMNLLFKPLSIALASIVVFVRAGGSIGSLSSIGRSHDSYNAVHGSNDGGEQSQ